MELVHLAHRILKRRDTDQLRLRGALRRLLWRRLAERPGTPFFARAEPAVPEIDEGLEAALERVELKTIHRALNVGAVPFLDQRLYAVARLPRRTRQPAGEEHVVFGLELFESGGE